MNHVVISFFNKDSREQFLRGPRTHLGSRLRTPSCKAGTIVILCDLTAQEAWGACTLKNWEGSTSPCREHHLLDEDVYSGALSKYNKYENCIDTLRILRNPIPFEDIRVLVGGADDKKTGNMWRGFHSSFMPPIGGDSLSIKRYILWANSLI
jgi:hypothetical protein